jgi:tetratricopeptide (TPR) repeat protein
MNGLATLPRIFAITCLLVVATASAQDLTPSEQDALRAYREGAFSQAVQLYTKALSETQDARHRARLHVNIAWTLFALGREGEVDTHLRAAIVEDPELNLVPDYYTQEFVDLFDAARSKRNEPLVNASDGAPPPDLEATVASIQQRLDEGSDLEGALSDTDRLLTFFPGDGRLVPLRIQLLQRLGRGDEAEQYAATYGADLGGSDLVDRLSIPDLIMRANRLLDQGDTTTSLELLREAVARQPSNVAALELMAEAAQRAGRWQEAEFALKSALGLQADNIGLKLRLGEVYLAKGETSAARDVFREITLRFPHSDRAWAALGLLEATLGNHDRALEELETALSENPLLPEVQLAYGELLLEKGDASAALEALRSASNLLLDDAQLQARIGQALLALGRDHDALASLRNANSAGYHPPDVERALALALLRNGLLSEAERVLDGLGRNDRGDADVIRSMLLLERGLASEAEPICRAVAAERTGDSGILALLGAIAYSQARYPEAVSLLDRAKKLAPPSPILDADLARAVAARDAELLANNARFVKAPPG